MKLDDLVGGYVDVVNAVLDGGHEASPRGALTRELLSVTLEIDAGAPMLPVGVGRKVSTRLAAVEALQVCGGFSDASAFAEWPHMLSFADEGSFHGAYGPRIRPQLDAAVRRLRQDCETRCAVVTLWDPLRDQVDGLHNYPCATELQLMARAQSLEVEGEWGPRRLALDLHVTMRANDAWRGLAYDAFVFNQLQHTVARMLGVPVGTYYHHATSLHLYEEHWPLVERLSPPSGPAPWQPRGFASPERARRLHEPGGALLDRGEAWYAERTA